MSDYEMEAEPQYDNVEVEVEQLLGESLASVGPQPPHSVSVSREQDKEASGSRTVKKGSTVKSSDRLGGDATKLLSHLTHYFDDKMESLK